MEIFCGSENYSSELEFNLNSIGAIWDVEWPSPYVQIFTIDIDGSSNGGLFVADPNVEITDWAGYNYIPTPKRIPAEDFGFGLYKLSLLNFYFYLDWRDARYGSYTNCNGHCADIYIKYDGFSDEVFIKNKADFSWGNPIVNGSLFTIWELKNQGPPSTLNVPDFWQNCLAVGYHYDENNPQPLQIAWGRYPDENQYTYYLFREIDSGWFVLIGVFNSSTFNYQDKSILSL